MLELIALPAFDDNYIWLLHDGRRALVVDPGDSAPVSAYLDRHQLTLEAVFITHHHHDHTGGLSALTTRYQPVIYAADHAQIRTAFPQAHYPADGSALSVLGHTWQVLAAPGHTLSHLLFYSPNVALQQGAAPLLFVGDTLFSLGCGRLFEGSPAQMLSSLARISQLPRDTWLCPAHEYTAHNLRFALATLPPDPELQVLQQHILALRAAAQPSLPCRLAQELRFNPFLRSLEPEFSTAIGLHLQLHAPTPLAVFTELRQRRNEFS